MNDITPLQGPATNVRAIVRENNVGGNNQVDDQPDPRIYSRFVLIRKIQTVFVIVRKKNSKWLKIAEFFDWASIVTLPLLWIYSYCLYNTVLYHNFRGYYDPFSGASLGRESALILANKHLLGVRLTLAAHALGIIVHRFGYGADGSRRRWWGARALLSCLLMEPWYGYKLAWYGIYGVLALIAAKAAKAIYL